MDKNKLEFFKLTDRVITDLYDSMLDDCYDDVNICGLNYVPSRALKEVDPIAYRCGCNDYIDSLLEDEIFTEIDGDYYYTETLKEEGLLCD